MACFKSCLPLSHVHPLAGIRQLLTLIITVRQEEAEQLLWGERQGIKRWIREETVTERNGRRVDQREGGMIMPNKLPSLLPRLSLWALEHAMSSGSALPTCTPVSSIHSFRVAAFVYERQWLQQRVSEICFGEIVWAWKQKQCRRRQHAEKWMLSSSGLQLRFEPFLSFLLWVIHLFKYVGSTDKTRFLHVYRFFHAVSVLIEL